MFADSVFSEMNLSLPPIQNLYYLGIESLLVCFLPSVSREVDRNLFGSSCLLLGFKAHSIFPSEFCVTLMIPVCARHFLPKISIRLYPVIVVDHITAPVVFP